ncbi:MAG: hypothetical protein QMD85_03520 [Candidatus Aenigmarchaeota archaeon]|nr:hypothetical protein [Candidatus Aenigmarchaeota archaeon]
MERKELLMVVMIGVLLLTTAMQTISLASLGSQAPVTAKSVAQNPAGGSDEHMSSGSSAGSLSNLPSMVGGC